MQNLLYTAMMWPMITMKTLNLPFQKSVISHSYQLMIMHLVHCLYRYTLILSPFGLCVVGGEMMGCCVWFGAKVLCHVTDFPTQSE